MGFELTCSNVQWGKTCIGPNGDICGGAAPITEGCEEGSCTTCFRADLNYALPSLGKAEPKRRTYFVGHFIDGSFMICRARGFKGKIRMGDFLLEINGRKVTPVLMRGIWKWTPAVVEVKALKHRVNRMPEVVTFRAGRNPS